MNDDEECTHIANEGSGDEIITPVYVAVNRQRPTTPSSMPNRNRPNVWRKPCQNDDDDDCDVEGSGSNEPDSPPVSNHSLYDNYYYSSTARSWTTWVPPTVAPMNRPPVSGGSPPFYNTPPPFYTYGGNQYGNEYNPEQIYPIRPKTTAPSWTKPVYSVSGPTRPIVLSGQPLEPQGPPEIFDVPLNIPAVTNDTVPSQVPEVLSRATNDRTVMIISIIAICLIVVVIIAPIVLFFKVRLQPNDAAYKVETFGGPKYGSTMPIQGGGYPSFPVVRATSVSGIPGHPGLGGGMPPGMMHPNAMNTMGRASRAGTRPGTPTDMMKKKDPHEWYV